MARFRLYSVRMEMNAAKEKDRLRAKEEARKMAVEDESSKKVEEDYRNNDALKQKLEAEKRQRWREEKERVRKIHFDAATRIQKRFRGMWGRAKSRVNKAQVKLERAISSRSETGLKEAISLVDTLDIKSKHVKVLCQNAKDLLLEVEGEVYVKEQLEEAIVSASDVLLTDAIQLAEDAGMVYLDELRRAKSTLEKVKQRREVLNSIRAILNRCDSVPKLLANTDRLSAYVYQATALGLGGEYLVQDTVLRCQRLKSLIYIRNDIRYAVELCSIKRMKSSMEARNRLLRIYGPELCGEEAAAVMNMMRMFSLSPQELDDDDDEAGETSESGDEDNQNQQLSDSLLPPFVREQLDKIHNAKNSDDAAAATEKLHLLVPNETKRKRYVRLFKWVVSFATWKYGKEAGHLEPPGDLEKSGNSHASAGGLVKGHGFIPSPTRASSSPTKRFSPGKDVTGTTSTSPSKKTLSLGSQVYRQRKLKSDDVSGVTMQESVDGGEKPFIPFSQRQSKSAVAAYQALKKRNKAKENKYLSASKADRMIAETLRDYNRFYHKHKGESGWQG